MQVKNLKFEERVKKKAISVEELAQHVREHKFHPQHHPIIKKLEVSQRGND